MMKAITTKDLRVADILLSRGDSDVSAGIAELDGGSYSHAALWSGHLVVESTLPVVKRSTLDECADHALHIDAFRHRAQQIPSSNIMELANTYLGRPYASLNLGLATLLIAVSSWMPYEWAEMNALYGAGELARLLELLKLAKDCPDEEPQVTCVELVVRCYHDVGTPIGIQLRGERRFPGISFLKAVRDVAQRLRAQARERAGDEMFASGDCLVRRCPRPRAALVADVGS